VQAYLHHNGKVGVLVEVDCETDFVARTDDFTVFAREVASHIAARRRAGWRPRTSPRRRARRSNVSSSRRPRQAARHPREDRRGKLQKWLSEVVLLEQVHVNADKHEGKTIASCRTSRRQDRENVLIRRFARFVVGE